MNDPHVVALIYRVEHGDTFNYDNTAPLNLETSEFRLTIEDKQARFELKNDYATDSEAQQAIERYIRVWVFDACLRQNDPDYFRLKFDKSVIEDRNPTPGVRGVHKVNAGTINWKFDLSSPSVTIGPANYPSLPSDIRLDADTETMFQRYMGYCRGLEKLTSMAYFCLTVLEESTQQRLVANNPRHKALKKRQQAAMEHDIDVNVL